MVYTFGNNIVGAYTGGDTVSAIYMSGIQVWPDVPSTYYIKWTPSYIRSGTFSINGSVYNFSNYSSGEFTFSTGVITKSAFRNNSYIETVETNALAVDTEAFLSCTNLTYANLTDCRFIYGQPAWGAFKACINLSRVRLPKCITIGDSTFASCDNLEGIYLPYCISIGNGAFENCYYKFSFASLPECRWLGAGVFDWCHTLSFLDLPKVSYIGGGNIGPTDMSSLILRFLGVVSGDGSHYHTGSVYVYGQWVDDYRSDPYWMDRPIHSIPSTPGWPFYSYPSWIYD